EDMQWADASLLDFVEHLLEWARNSPLFVVTAARPELVEKRPTWGAGKRNFTSIYLEPLSEPAMRALLSGLVPGLPEQLARQILDRAEGVPLYAMETVRMLLDRNLLVQEGSIYRPAGEVESLEVPETLQALIAARLDGLSAAERRLVQDGAVLGKTFTKQALAALSDTREEELAPVLASLVRKEVLSIQADPRSPEHGQYGFLQDLVRHVAYETLSWRDRHTRHLAAAAYLERAFPDDDEIVEVLASHYLDAYRAAPEGGPEEVKSRARELLQRAAARAGSLGAPAEAQRYYVQAAELSDPGLAQAILLDRAAEMAVRSADQDGAVRLAEAAHVLFEQAGDHGAAARASGRIAAVEQDRGQMNEAIARMAQALEVLRGEPVGEDLALLAARLGRSYWFAGQVEKAAECSELALEIGEALGLPEPLVQAWMTKAMVDSGKGRLGEARVLMRGALELALEHGLGEGASVAAANLSDLAFHRDRYTEALELLEQSGEQARRLGDRPREWFTISEATYALYQLGRWDEALAAYFELPEEMLAVGGALISPLTGVLELHVNRGDLAAARSLLAIYSRLERSVDVQERGGWTGAVAAMRVAEGAYAAALAAGREALEFGTSLGFGSQSVKQGWLWSAEAASALGDRAAVEDLLSFVENLPPGRRPRLLEAHALRISARVAADQEADRLFRAAAVRFRDIGLPFWMAVTLLERVERTLSAGEGLAEAVEIFTRLGAEPWLERARAASGHPRLAAAPGAAD
ncbi:MAG TPA: tetratricopeptide repeat protein, partial [Gaiellales bacterium]|nr:tetratricopeptide repeat protein [Gaiellales bacterium]